MEPAVCDKLHNTSGGDIDTELNEFAVRPTKLPSGARPVTTVTPVANIPSAVRNSALEKVGGVAFFGRTEDNMVGI
jgi:hypothetical protein